MKKSLSIAVSTTCLLMGGCSSTVHFVSKPPGAVCSVRNAGIVNSKFVTPVSLSIPNSGHPLRTTCNKEGYETMIIETDSHTFGGTYPEQVTIPLIKKE